MAYINQSMKKELSYGIKEVLKKYGVKGTIGVDNHSCLVVNIKEGAIDFIGHANEQNRKLADERGITYYPSDGYLQMNPYRTDDVEGVVGKFMTELVAAMKGRLWYDNSDIMTDYFDTAYYLNINVGKWDRPYVYTGEIAAEAA
jgi:hypothetical protein